jgi:3-dehydroquinate dehydratase-2
MAKILLLNGPNLNLLGTREPTTYGNKTLADITKHLEKQATDLGHQLIVFQSNAEHELINKIHTAKQEKVEFIIINPGAFTHTSLALRDAFLAVAIPFIETHLSNIYARETFRHHSYLSDIAVGVITGFSAYSYDLALQAAHHILTNQR